MVNWVVGLFLLTVGTPGGPSHSSEIKLFATTMAIAKTVKTECRDTEVDDYYLEAMRLRLHVVEADYPVFAAEARGIAAVLHQALQTRQAGSRGAARFIGCTDRTAR